MIISSFLFCAVLVLVTWSCFCAKHFALGRALFVLAIVPLFALMGQWGSIALHNWIVWLFLVVGFEAGRLVKMRPRTFAVCCALGPISAFGTLMAQFVPNYLEHQRLVARYPFEDMAPRLSYETQAARSASQMGDAAAVPPHSAEMVEELEAQLNFEARVYENPHRYRRDALSALSQVHANFVLDFIRQPEFGYRRMMFKTPLRESQVQLLPPLPIPQPPPPPTATSFDVAAAKANVDAGDPVLERHVTADLDGSQPLPEFNLHRVVDFARLESLGFVNSQREARGFQPHGFRNMPGPITRQKENLSWKLARLELVSLLKNQPAAAYVSEHLPAMDELKNVSTRPLDAFESAALARLRQGEEIVTEVQHNEQRMVGAIRAAEQCRECHQIPKGGLLGAFTYRFYRDPLLPEPAREERTKNAEWNQRRRSLAAVPRDGL